MTTQPDHTPFAPGAQGQPARQAALAKTAGAIGRRQADRHEALYLKLVPLARQAEAAARKNPVQPVPEALRTLAESALYESQGFSGHRRKGGLAPAAPHYGALAAQLGAALADLVGFEARHTRWDSKLGAQMWLLRHGEALPVRRLMPRLLAPMPQSAEDARKAAYMLDLRQKLARRIDQFNRR